MPVPRTMSWSLRVSAASPTKVLGCVAVRPNGVVGRRAALQGFCTESVLDSVVKLH